MSRCHPLFLGIVILALLPPQISRAQQNDGPLISIESPDTASTFVYGSIKSHSLIWNKKEKTLVAQITFIDTEENSGSASEDTHEFRLPGVTFDEAKGTFFAYSAHGVAVPVAHIKKSLFFKSIEALPNAIVRIQRLKGSVSVILEAISPDDPAMHSPAGTNDHQSVNLQSVFQ